MVSKVPEPNAATSGSAWHSVTNSSSLRQREGLLPLDEIVPTVLSTFHHL